MKPRVLVTRAIFPEIIAKLEEFLDVQANQTDVVFDPPELMRRLADKDGPLTSAGCRVDATVLGRAPSLKAVCNMAVGTNNLHLPAFAARGVVATNTPDVLTETTADFGWALLMAAARRVRESDAWLREGHWDRWTFNAGHGSRPECPPAGSTASDHERPPMGAEDKCLLQVACRHTVPCIAGRASPMEQLT